MSAPLVAGTVGEEAISHRGVPVARDPCALRRGLSGVRRGGVPRQPLGYTRGMLAPGPYGSRASPGGRSRSGHRRGHADGPRRRGQGPPRPGRRPEARWLRLPSQPERRCSAAWSNRVEDRSARSPVVPDGVVLVVDRPTDWGWAPIREGWSEARWRRRASGASAFTAAYCAPAYAALECENDAGDRFTILPSGDSHGGRSVSAAPTRACGNAAGPPYAHQVSLQRQ